MFKAVLIDLDNTMLLFDEPAFHKRFMAALGAHFAHLAKPEEVRRRTIAAVRALRSNNPRRDNRTLFVETFSTDLPCSPPEVWAQFESFYQGPYADLRPPVDTPHNLHPVLAQLRAMGLIVAVATNPIYPLSAVETRMRWAGLEAETFDLVTHLENMCFVKPQTGYYRQICDLIATPPEACLMAGNDPVNDMAAAHTGMHTFRTTDVQADQSLSLTMTESDDHPVPDNTGPFSELAQIVEAACHL
jgi:FMN phosphatase YigB (HAD superfamily)